MARTTRPRMGSRLGLESLECRLVPATVTQIREATGANAAAIQTARDDFRTDLGGGVAAGANGSFGGVRREINWDGTPAARSSPNPLPADFFNTTSPRGVVFATPGTSFQVSGANADVGPANVRFGNLNGTYTTAFGAFSPERLFTPVGSNVVDVQFFIAGTTTPAVVRGFGAVFTDVDTAGSTRLEFFDADGNRVLSRDVQATAGNASFSFLGVVFAGNTISRVRITSGNGAVGTNDVTQGGTSDIAVMDDFIYGEPVLPSQQQLVVSGQSDASATTFIPDRATGQYPSTATATLNPFGTGTTNVRTGVGDLNGDGIPDTVLVTGPGTPIRVAAISGADNTTVLVAPFDPFGGDFTGGGFVAVGDLTGDGNAEFAVSPDQGGGPRVSIYSFTAVGTAPALKSNFFGIDDPAFRGGARPALGDVNGDGVLDLAVGAGFLGGPRVALFNGTTLTSGTPTRLIGDFFAFPGTDATTLRNGVFVAIGDVTGDGKGELIFGGGPGGAPRVFILNGVTVSAGDVAGAQNSPVANFYVAGNNSDRGGVRLATTDADGDNRSDVAAASGEGSPAKVRVYLGKNFTGGGEPATFQDLTVLGGAPLAGGVYVG